MFVLYFFILSVVAVAILLIVATIIKNKKEYYIHRVGTRYYLYRNKRNGHYGRIEDYVAKPNITGCYDFDIVHFVYKDIEMAKKSLMWHKRGCLKYKGYKITHVIKNGELAFRFKGEGSEFEYYMVFPSVELCKQAIEELIERKIQEEVQYKKENEIIYL